MLIFAVKYNKKRVINLDNSDFPVYLTPDQKAGPGVPGKKGSTMVRLETSGNITVKKIKE